jgi:hypothetical protein
LVFLGHEQSGNPGTKPVTKKQNQQQTVSLKLIDGFIEKNLIRIGLGFVYVCKYAITYAEKLRKLTRFQQTETKSLSNLLHKLFQKDGHYQSCLNVPHPHDCPENYSARGGFRTGDLHFQGQMG